MSIIIAAAGSSTRWNNHLGIPKQLSPVDGVPIIHRTQRLFQKECDRILLTYDERMLDKKAGYRIIRPDKTEYSILPFTAIGHSYPHWDNKCGTLLLFGDVYFTDAASNAIWNTVETAEDVTWIGRLTKHGIKPYGELFGLFIPLHKMSALVIAIRDLKHWRDMASEEQLKKVGGWYLIMKYLKLPMLYASLCWNNVQHNFLQIEDETDDFDYPSEYNDWLSKHTATP